MRQKLTAKEEEIMQIIWSADDLFIRDIVERYYGNSYSMLVSQFVEDDKMDLEELKQLIATIESKKK